VSVQQATAESVRRLRAQVHIAKKDLGLDDETYRALLQRVTGKTSSAKLSVVELNKVVADLRSKGWKPRLGGRSPASKHRVIKSRADKLRAVWIGMAKSGVIEDGSEQALAAWVKRQTSNSNGIGIDRVDWLDRDPKQAVTVLESLKRWNQRVQDEWRNDDLALISRTQKVEDRPQVDVIRDLLADRRIMYWPLFSELDIEQPEHLVEDRRLLQ
jgi:phage gp16-like protein